MAPCWVVLEVLRPRFCAGFANSRTKNISAQDVERLSKTPERLFVSPEFPSRPSQLKGMNLIKIISISRKWQVDL